MENEKFILKNSEIKLNFLIGVSLAISSCFFIGISFIIKKKALLKINIQGSKRASLGGYSYLKEWLWWCGLISMGVGEIFNFVAYTFAPASLVTPLGALSILVTVVLSHKFLNEKLNFISKLGCVLCITGSIQIVLNAPKENEIYELSQLGTSLMNPLFVLYVGLVIIFSSILIFRVNPKYGNEYVVVNILICSLIGSLSVMACKGIGIAIFETCSGAENDFKHVLFYFLIFVVLVTISIQMTYLNKALDIFDTSIVTTIYYVFFTSFVLLASSILFQEWNQLNLSSILGTLSGFITVIIAIIMLNAFKDQNNHLYKNSFCSEYDSLITNIEI